MNWPPHERQKESDVQRIGLQHPTRFRLPDGMKNQGLQYYIHDESDALRSGQLLMAAGEGSILAGPVGTIALMFNGGEGSSQS